MNSRDEATDTMELGEQSQMLQSLSLCTDSSMRGLVPPQKRATRENRATPLLSILLYHNHFQPEMLSRMREVGRCLLAGGVCKNHFSKGPGLKHKMRTEYSGKPIKSKRRQYTYYQIGLYGLVFTCCFAAIPLYRVFCEHIGLVGNYDQKTYDFKDKEVVNLKKFLVKFKGEAESGIDWEFEPIEKQVMIGTSETAIVFYRLRSRENRPIVGFSTYNIAPEEANLYFSKIQCFCFNQQMINPEEELLLPIFFYLQPQMLEDMDVARIQDITVNYQFYESKNQDLAKFAQEQLLRIESNKKKLNEMRASKKNMTIEEYEDYIEQKEEEEMDTLPQIDLPIPLRKQLSKSS